MSKIIDGTPVDAATTNPAFLGRRDDDYTTGKLGLSNTDVASGTAITSIQQELNAIDSFIGQAPNQVYNNKPSFVNNQGFSTTDDLRIRTDSVSGKFNSSTGHKHTGAGGDAPKIESNDINSVPLRGYFYQAPTLTGITGSSVDVSTQLTGETPSSGSAVKGIVVSAPYNQCPLRDSNNDQFLSPTGDEIYGRIGWAASVWTLSFYYLNGAVETAYTFSTSTTIKWFYQKLLNPIVDAPVYDPLLIIPSENATADVVDASATQRGLVSTGTQSFAGNKTFTGTIGASNLSGTNTGDVSLTAVGSSPNANAASLSGQALTLQPADGSNPGVLTSGVQTIGGNKTLTGTIGASNLSGTNSGDVSLTAFGSTPNANGASLSGQALTLHPADSSNPGGVSTTTQSFAGEKTFTGNIIANSQASLNEYLDTTTTGALATISNLTRAYHVLKNASLVSVQMISSPTDGKFVVLTNNTGADITIKNLSGGTASQQIITGTGNDLSLKNTASIILIYDLDATKWRVVGGSGGSGSTTFQATAANNITQYQPLYINSSGQVDIASWDSVNSTKFCGIALNSATTGNTVTVQILGEITNPSWSFSYLGTYIYLGSGSVSENRPSGSRKYTVILGIIKSSNTIELIFPIISRPDVDGNLIINGNNELNNNFENSGITSTIGLSAIQTGPGLIDITNDFIQFPSYVYSIPINSRVQFTSTGSLPGGLTAGVNYYVIYEDLSTYRRMKVSTSIGGAQVDLTSTGSGTINCFFGVPFYYNSGFGNPLNFASNSTNPLNGAYDFLLSKPASLTLGSIVKYIFDVPKNLKAKVCKISFDYIVNSGTFVAGNPSDKSTTGDSDVTIWIYDLDANTLIQPSTYRLYSNSTKISSKFEAEFQTNASSSYYALYFVSATGSTSAFALQVDNIKVELNNLLSGGGSQGTRAAISANQNIPSTSITKILLNSVSSAYGGYDTAGMFDSVNNRIIIQESGKYLVTSQAYLTNVASGNNGVLYLYKNGSAIRLDQRINGASLVDILLLLTDEIEFIAGDILDIRVSSTDSNYDVISNTGATTFLTVVKQSSPTSYNSGVIASRATKGGTDQTGVNTNASFVKLTWPTIAISNNGFDLNGSMDTANNRYNVSTPGIYSVDAGILVNGTNVLANSYFLSIFKNGSEYARGPLYSASVGSQFQLAVKSNVQANAGDYIEIFIYGYGNNSVNTLNIAGTNFLTFFDVSKIYGSSAIASTETISARYTTSAGQSIANDSNFYIIDFGTRVKDSTNSVTTGAAWKFVAPVPGEYQLSCTVLYNSFSWNAGEISNARLYKNGAAYSNLFRFEAQATRSTFAQIPCQPIKLNLLAGDYIDVRISNNRSGGATSLINDSLFNWIDIIKIGNY